MVVADITHSENQLIMITKKARYYYRQAKSKKAFSAIGKAMKELGLTKIKSQKRICHVDFYKAILKHIVENNERDISSAIQRIQSCNIKDLAYLISQVYQRVKVHENGDIDNIKLLTTIKKINSFLPKGKRFWFVYEAGTNWHLTKTKMGKLVRIEMNYHTIWSTSKDKIDSSVNLKNNFIDPKTRQEKKIDYDRNYHMFIHHCAGDPMLYIATTGLACPYDAEC